MKVQVHGLISVMLDGEPVQVSLYPEEIDGAMVPFTLDLGDQKLSPLMEWETEAPHLPLRFGFELRIPAENLGAFLVEEGLENTPR